MPESLFGWIAAQIPVQPHKCSAFGLRGVAGRMHWSTAADQPKSYESCLTVVTLIEGCPRKRNSAKQALSSTFRRSILDLTVSLSHRTAEYGWRRRRRRRYQPVGAAE